MSDTLSRQNLVKISTASHRSGVRIETLRAWDNRRQVQPTRRVGNARYYTEQQVERITAMNTLIQSGLGYTIGDLCEKTDDEIHQLVADLHENPSLRAVTHSNDTPAAVIVGWRLMGLRDTALEQNSVRTIAPNLQDAEAFFEYLRRLDHDGLQMAFIELPCDWNLNYINELRDKVDALNQSDCHIVCVSFYNDPASFERYSQEAQQRGVSLLDGEKLNWQGVLDEINNVLVMRRETVADPATLISASELARLSSSATRISGVAITDIVRLYQLAADMVGLAKREAGNDVLDGESRPHQMTQRLNTAYAELVSCVELAREIDREMSSIELDKTKHEV